jgi:hypothetical protein
VVTIRDGGGHESSPVARSLRNNRTNVIGILVSDVKSSTPS